MVQLRLATLVIGILALSAVAPPARAQNTMGLHDSFSNNRSAIMGSHNGRLSARRRAEAAPAKGPVDCARLNAQRSRMTASQYRAFSQACLTR